MKEKFKQDEERRKLEKEKRDARKDLIPDDPEPKAEPVILEESPEVYTVIQTFKPFSMTLADPEQTFKTTFGRDTLIGCHFEPAVAKVLKADQKKKGQGWQSHLVNELVKQYYKQIGKL